MRLSSSFRQSPVKPLFERSSTLPFRFWFFVVLSFVFYFLDKADNPIIERLRLNISAATVFFYDITNEPIKLVHQWKENFSSQESLITQNQQLLVRDNQLLLRLQQWQVLEQENQQLRQLLALSPRIDGKVTGAQITKMNGWSGNQIIVLNKGRANGIFIGQIVLDAYGLVGQVIRVNWFNSIVLPITDLKSAIPIEVVRTNKRGILVGTGSLKTVLLNNFTKTVDIQKGDQLVTSALGGCLPTGYPVGIVRSINKDNGDMFAQVSVSPLAHFTEDTFVFLVWPNPEPHSYLTPIKWVPMT